MADAVRPLRRTTRVRSAILAVAFGVAFVVLYALAILTPAGQEWDAATLGTFGWLRGEGWLSLYGARDLIPFLLLGLAAVAGVEGMIRRRWVAVVSAGALVMLTGLASFAFKGGLLPRPYLGDFAYTYQTFPSGHTAMSLAAVVAIIWFGPRWLHPIVVVVLGVVVGLVACASLLSYAHRGSDVVGGALLVGAVAFAISAIAGVPPLGRQGPRAIWTVIGLMGMVAGAVVFSVALGAIASGGPDIPALIDPIGASVVVAVAGAIAVVLANQYPVQGDVGP